MNKRLLGRLMQQRFQDLLQSKGYFFRANSEFVLRGFAFEYVPDGLYIWDFRFPLFDFFGPNLLYSNRLASRAGFVGTKELDERGIVEFVATSPEAAAFLGSDPSETPLAFANFVEAQPVLLQNSHAKLIYSASLILAKRVSQALRSALIEGTDKAEDILHEVMGRNRIEFGM
jgi:hypothetical protein